MLKLVEISNEYIKEIEEFKKEVLEYDKDNEDQFAGCLGLREAKTIEDWVALCINRKNGLTKSVPSTVYLAIDNNELVGIIDLRHHINHPILSTWGGHSGYSVRPTKRGLGYAKEMLRLLLIKAKEMNITDFLITCSVNNLASEAVIKANGGIYETTLEVDTDHIKRYWIHLE